MKKIALIPALLILVAGPVAAQVTDLIAAPENPKVEAQREGDFPPMQRTDAPGGAIQSVWDDAPPGAGVYTVQWKEGETIRVRLREGMISTIVLPEWDEIDEDAIADQTNFGKKRAGSKNKLWVWSRYPGFDTNVNVIGTSGNVYTFYLRGETWNSKNISDQIVFIRAVQPQITATASAKVSAVVPVNAANAATPANVNNPSAEWLRDLPFDPGKIRNDLEMSGEKDIAPVYIFRDDRFTYLDYGVNADSATWPGAWQVIDQVDHPVNIRKSKDGRYLIVETINPITLRHGERTVCIRRK